MKWKRWMKCLSLEFVCLSIIEALMTTMRFSSARLSWLPSIRGDTQDISEGVYQGWNYKGSVTKQSKDEQSVSFKIRKSRVNWLPKIYWWSRVSIFVVVFGRGNEGVYSGVVATMTVHLNSAKFTVAFFMFTVLFTILRFCEQSSLFLPKISKKFTVLVQFTMS